MCMLFFMRHMYKDRRANMAIVVASVALLVPGLWLVRSQATVADIAWMTAMIPHHWIANLASERARISDPRVRKPATASSRRSDARSPRWKTSSATSGTTPASCAGTRRVGSLQPASDPPSTSRWARLSMVTRTPRTAIGVAFLLAIGLGWLSGRLPALVAIAYGALSAFAVLLYGIDKSAAVDNRWRVQESSLHLVALLGGWPGALLAQDVFRHKSSKAAFQNVFWATVVCNGIGLAWLLGRGGLA